jgi:hypothetical protein
LFKSDIMLKLTAVFLLAVKRYHLIQIFSSLFTTQGSIFGTRFLAYRSDAASKQI